MSNHTPGPWHYEPANVRGFKVLIGRKHASADVLLVGAGGGNPEIVAQDKANARLIASAPDLLEACQKVMKWASEPGDHGGNPYMKAFVKAAQAAIEKATQ